jgi:hypothetical protein
VLAKGCTNVFCPVTLEKRLPVLYSMTRLGTHRILIWPGFRLIQKPDTGYPVRQDTGNLAGFSVQVKCLLKFEGEKKLRNQNSRQFPFLNFGQRIVAFFKLIIFWGKLVNYHNYIFY